MSKISSSLFIKIRNMKFLLIALVTTWVVGAWLYFSWVTFDDVKNADFKTIQQKVETKINGGIEDVKNAVDEGLSEKSDKENGVVEYNDATETKVATTGLEKIYGSYNNVRENKYDFRQAKKVLNEEVYNEKELRQDNYCWDEYNSYDNKIIKNSFVSQSKNSKRWDKIEWEHVVPAENFGKSFVEWREWNTELCWNKKWRECAWKNETFKMMEWDIYNLIPANGEINWTRSNLKFGVVTSNNYISYWDCSFKIDRKEKVAEPMDSTKGMVARISLYFTLRYPEHYKLSDQQAKLFSAWNKQFPPTNYECKVAAKKEKLAWYPNLVTKAECQKLWDYNDYLK